MEILPGIGRVEKISGKHEIFSGHCTKKAGQDTTFKQGQIKMGQKGDPFACHAFQ